MNDELIGGVQAFAIIATILLASGLGAVLLRGLWRWIERGTAPAPAGDLEELKARVAELEADRGRVAELEERVDFAERLLADRERVPERLGDGA
jgi:hypothetical protein